MPVDESTAVVAPLAADTGMDVLTSGPKVQSGHGDSALAAPDLLCQTTGALQTCKRGVSTSGIRHVSVCAQT